MRAMQVGQVGLVVSFLLGAGCAGSAEMPEQEVPDTSSASHPSSVSRTLSRFRSATQRVQAPLAPEPLASPWLQPNTPEPLPRALNLAGLPLQVAASTLRPVLSPSPAIALHPTADGWVPEVPRKLQQGAWRSTARPANVTLPTRANGWFSVEDSSKPGFAIRARLLGATPREGEVEQGFVVYPDALGSGVDVVQRPELEGVEDFVRFASKPAEEALWYEVDVSAVAGLRMVPETNVLEFMTEEGNPQLRVAPPYGVDAHGKRVEATLRVEGCALDEDARAPWGREVTKPGAKVCRVGVRWTSEEGSYPVTVDPAWVTTGSMVYDRMGHTTTPITTNGKQAVLAVGGTNEAAVTSEIFYAETWTMTSNLNKPRNYHEAIVRSLDRITVIWNHDPVQPDPITYLETYNANDGKWVEEPSLTQSWSQFYTPAVALISGDRLFVMSQYQPYPFVLNNGLWQKSSSPIPQNDLINPTPGVVPLNSSEVLVLLDSCDGCEKSFKYNIASQTWSPSIGGTPLLNQFQPERQFQPIQLDTNKVFLDGYIFDGSKWNTPSKPGFIEKSKPRKTVLIGDYVYLVSGAAYNWIDGTWLSIPTPDSLLKPDAISKYSTNQLLATGLSKENFGNSALSTPELLDSVGGSCSFDENCSQGYCVDGVCCNKPCSGKCEACIPSRTGEAPGICAPVITGTDPDNECSDDGAFSGAQNGYCDGAGACQKYLNTTGSPCSLVSDCTSSKCVDGVCCDSACTSKCVACSSARKGQGIDGLCEPIIDGLDPDNECPTGGSSTCGGDFVCNGAGLCRSGKQNEICNPAPSCPSETTQINPDLCDEQGICQKKGTSNCVAYKCKGNACLTSCSADTDCQPPNLCINGKCSEGKNDGETCSTGIECNSSFCVAKVCCNEACEGACQACGGENNKQGPGGVVGVCGVALEGSNPNGKCQASGTECGAPGTCDAQGKCATAASVSKSCGKGGVCATSTVFVGEHCDGQGSCIKDDKQQPCKPGYTCSEGLGKCLDVCGSDADCATEFKCSSNQCIQKTYVKCAGNSVIEPDGTETSCGEYQCVEGTGCLTSCNALKDCAEGFVCEGGECTKGSNGGAGSSAAGAGGVSAGNEGNATPEDGGCGCAVPGRSQPVRGAWLGAALGLVAFLRRRRAAGASTSFRPAATVVPHG